MVSLKLRLFLVCTHLMDSVELHVSPVLDTWPAPHSPRLQVSGFAFPGHIQVMSSQSCSYPPSDHINTAQLQIISAFHILSTIEIVAKFWIVGYLSRLFFLGQNFILECGRIFLVKSKNGILMGELCQLR